MTTLEFSFLFMLVFVLTSKICKSSGLLGGIPWQRTMSFELIFHAQYQKRDFKSKFCDCETVVSACLI